MVKTLAAMGFESGVRVCGPTESDLFALISRARPADGAMRMAVAGYFEAQATDAQSATTWAASMVSDISVSELLGEDDYGNLDGLEQVTQVEVAFPRLVGLREVEVDDVDDTDGAQTVFVSFTLLILCDLAIEGYDLDNSGVIVMDQRDVSSVLVSAPCVAELDSNRMVGAVHQSDTADATSAQERFSASYSAFRWLLSTLKGLSGITIDIDQESLQENSIPEHFTLSGDNGETNTATVNNGDPGEPPVSWQVHVDGAEVVIACEYDANSRVWLGREDSFDMLPPYIVTSSSLAASHAGEPWSAIGSIWRSLTTRDRVTGSSGQMPSDGVQISSLSQTPKVGHSGATTTIPPGPMGW